MSRQEEETETKLSILKECEYGLEIAINEKDFFMVFAIAEVLKNI